MIEFRKPERELVLDLINENNPNNPHPLVSEWATLGPVVEVTPSHDEPRNTKVMVTCSLEAPLAGSWEYFYNRIDINDFKHGGLVRSEDLRIDVETVSSSKDLYQALSDILYITISEDMIVDELIPLVNFGDEVSFTVRFKPENYVITGELAVTLIRPQTA